jgi:cytidylate kinase
MDLEFDCEEVFTVRLNGEDITSQLPTETTGNAASIVAVYPNVRQVLLQKQKNFQQLPGLVADGRDMGSVVFPDAQYKVYLTASAEERALRRYKQLIEKGIDANLIQITSEIEERDQRDRQRAIAPLMVPEGAHYLDSSHLNIQQVIAEVMNLVH